MDANTARLPTCNPAPLTSTELVWHNGCTATASSGTSRLLEGPDTDWDAPLLLATAAGASLLTEFIDLARGAPVLGYTARQSTEVDAATGQIVRVIIKACIVVATAAAGTTADTAWTMAISRAPVLQALQCAVQCEHSLVVLDDQAEVDAGS
jgi:hypothetical protein